MSFIPVPKGLAIVNCYKFVTNRLHVQRKVHPDFDPLKKLLLTLPVTNTSNVTSYKSFVNRSKANVPSGSKRCV